MSVSSPPSGVGEGGGFTLIEMMMVAVIVGILAALALPNFNRVMTRAAITRSIGDMRVIQHEVAEFRASRGRFPTTLGEVGRGTFQDPWGNPYRYMVIEGARGVGGFRKDRFLVPLNTDFDLYSMGPDGETTAPLSSAKGRDDVIRANDGGYLGLASDY